VRASRTERFAATDEHNRNDGLLLGPKGTMSEVELHLVHMLLAITKTEHP